MQRTALENNSLKFPAVPKIAEKQKNPWSIFSKKPLLYLKQFHPSNTANINERIPPIHPLLCRTVFHHKKRHRHTKKFFLL